MPKGIIVKSHPRRVLCPRLLAAFLPLALILCEPAFGETYVYEMPDGSRLITDHALNDKRCRLVRASGEVRGAGTLAAQKNSPVFRENSSAYDRLIKRLAEEYGVEFALVKAIMTVESAFNPYAVSAKGARGLMQVMPETASRYGVRDIYDPVENIRAAVQYLKYLSETFDHRHYLVIAAYNAGESAVKQYRGIPPFEETQSYVKKVLYYQRQYSAKSSSLAAGAKPPRVQVANVGHSL